MRFLRPVLAAALVVGGVALATEASADSVPKPAMQIKLKDVNVGMNDFSFPSGLRVIFQEDHGQPIVGLTMTIDHGSQDDPEGREGIAHLIEHLWFRSVHTGTDGKDLPKIMDFIKQMGAQFNATTSTDRTNYLTIVRSPLLETAMRLEALRLRDAVRKVTNENVLIEREVVRNELRLRYENDLGTMWGYLFEEMWPVGHPYHRGTIGSHDSLNAITLKDIQDYVQKYYLPSESTLVVAGDLKLSESSKYLEAFGIDQLAAPDDPTGKNLTLVPPKVRISGAAKEPPPPAKPVEIKGEVVNVRTVKGAVEKPLVVLGWSLPSGYTQQDAVMQAAASQLIQAINRELHPDWEYTQEEAPSGADCGIAERGRYGSGALCLIEIDEAEEGPKTIEKALNGLYMLSQRDEALLEWQQYLFTYSKQAGIASTLQLVDETTDLFAGRSALISDYVHFTGDPLFYSRQIEGVSAITMDQVRDYAGKYFKRERAVGILMEPYEEGDLTIDGSDSAYRGQSRDQSILTLFNPDEVNPAVIKDTIVVPDTKAIVQETLPNGMKLVILPHTQGPLVQVGISFGGGTGSVDLDRLAAIFTESTTAYSHGFNVNDPLAVAGSFGISFNALSVAATANASAGNVKDAMFVARYRIDDIIPSTSGRIGWVKDGKKDVLGWMKEKEAATAAGNIQSERLFPGHAYGQWLTHKDWDAMDKMGNAETTATLSKVLRPKNATIYVVGNIGVDEARDAAKTYFGGWTGWGKEPAGWKPPRAEYAPAPPPPERQVLLFNKELATQTQVSYQCQLAPITPENEWPAQIMADVVSDGLWLALREQTGASYGAYPYIDYQPGGVGIFGQGVSVQNDQTAFAVKVFIEQGERAKAGKLDDRIIATQKFNNAQAYVLGQASTSAMLGRLMRTGARGYGMEYFDKVAERIGNVKQSDFPPLLERCVGHEVITAVGPVAVIKPQFEKLGIPVEVVDLDAFRKDYRAKMGLKEEKEDKKKDKK